MRARSRRGRWRCWRRIAAAGAVGWRFNWRQPVVGVADHDPAGETGAVAAPAAPGRVDDAAGVGDRGRDVAGAQVVDVGPVRGGADRVALGSDGQACSPPATQVSGFLMSAVNGGGEAGIAGHLVRRWHAVFGGCRRVESDAALQPLVTRDRLRWCTPRRCCSRCSGPRGCRRRRRRSWSPSPCRRCAGSITLSCMPPETS